MREPNLIIGVVIVKVELRFKDQVEAVVRARVNKLTEIKKGVKSVLLSVGLRRLLL